MSRPRKTSAKKPAKKPPTKKLQPPKKKPKRPGKLKQPNWARFLAIGVTPGYTVVVTWYKGNDQPLRIQRIKANDQPVVEDTTVRVSPQAFPLPPPKDGMFALKWSIVPRSNEITQIRLDVVNTGSGASVFVDSTDSATMNTPWQGSGTVAAP